MARSNRLISNPANAHAHAKGAKVQPIQVAEHDRFGAISYVWPRHWVFHYNAAYAACQELLSLPQSPRSDAMARYRTWEGSCRPMGSS